MKKTTCFYYLIFFVCFCFFACILPYPILSRYTNSTEKQMSQTNQYRETELSKKDSQKNKVLSITWDEGINNLLETDSIYEIYDFTTKQSFYIKRIGGINHADVIPASKEDFSYIAENMSQNTCTPVALIFSSSTVIPASFYGYMHGYSDNNTQFHGHYCLHFKGSKTHSTNNIDYYHQKALRSAQKQAQTLLID